MTRFLHLYQGPLASSCFAMVIYTQTIYGWWCSNFRMVMIRFHVEGVFKKSFSTFWYVPIFWHDDSIFNFYLMYLFHTRTPFTLTHLPKKYTHTSQPTMEAHLRTHYMTPTQTLHYFREIAPNHQCMLHQLWSHPQNEWVPFHDPCTNPPLP